MYDKVVARGTANQTLKINEAFSETDSIELIDDFDDATEAKLYQKVSTKGSPKAGSAYSMTVENGVAKANDNDATVNKDDGTNNGKILNIINFGQAAKTVEGYYDVELPVAASSWTFFVINGSDTAKASGEIFGLRTVKVTENKTDKIYLKYRVDGGSETNPEKSIELTNNIKLGVHYVINVETQKITIEIVTFDANNNQTVNNFVTDLEIAGLKALDYAYLQTSDKNSNLFNIDNIVLNVGYKTLAEVKAYYSSLLESKATALSQDANYSFSYDMFTSELASNKEAIEESETIAEVIEAYKNSSLLNPVTDADLKALYVKILTDAKETLEDSYVYNATAFNNIFEPKIAAINNATTADAFSTAVEALKGYATELSAIESDPVVRSKRLTEYTTYNTAQADAIKALNLDTTEYNAAMLKLISVNAKYVSQDAENPESTTFQGCAITDIDDLLAAAKGELDAIVAEYSLSLEDLAKAYNEDLNTKKAAAKDKFLDNQFDAKVDEIEALVVTDTTTKATLKTAYEQKLAKLDYLDEWYDAVVAAIGEYREYAYAERDEKCLDKTENYKKYCIDVLSEYFNTRYTDLMAIEYSTDNYDELIADFIEITKEKVDEIIAEYREQTEWTVIFKKNETDTDENAYATVQVIKGGTITAPETDPKLEGFVFAGWNFDFDDTIEDDTEIVALWHDTYVAPKNTFLDFSGFDSSENSKVTSTAGIIEFYSNNSSDKVENSMLWINGATKSSRYLKIVVETDAKITIVVNPKDKDRYVAIASSAGSASSSGYTADTNTLKKASKNVDTTMTFNVTAGTYYINTSDKLYFKSINVEYSALTEIKEIKASIANDANLISVSNVKLVDIDGNEIAITEGYYVTVVNVTTNEEVENWQGALPAGNYRVYVQYGSYTVIVGPVKINGVL